VTAISDLAAVWEPWRIVDFDLFVFICTLYVCSIYMSVCDWTDVFVHIHEWIIYIMWMYIDVFTLCTHKFVFVYISTPSHLCMYSNTYIEMSTCVYMCTCTKMYVYINTYKQVHTCLYTFDSLAYIDTYICICVYIFDSVEWPTYLYRTHTQRARAHAHTHKHTRIYTHTHTHTHTLSLSLSLTRTYKQKHTHKCL